MMYFGRLKTWSILGVCLLGLLLCLPNFLSIPGPTIHLGLDLRGGSYLLLEVDMATVVRERLASLGDGARRALDRAGVRPYRLTQHPDTNTLEITLPDETRRAAGLQALQALAKSEQSGPGIADIDVTQPAPDRVALSLSPAALTQRGRQAVEQSIEIVRRRIDASGVADPSINAQGTDRLVVQLPGVADSNRIKELLGKTARMTFRLTDETANPDGPPVPGVDILKSENGGPPVAVRRRIEVDGADLTDARAGQNPQTGDWVVSFTFNSNGTRRFADVSRANVGHPFAIVLDDKVISAPVIREPITGGRGEISGRFDVKGANDLAVLLRAGALPAPLTVIEEHTVGPELGADSIRAGAISLLVGFLLVVGYMGIFYGLFGWIANIALLVNLVLMLAILSVLGATLTLPGMAGILLTLGMAVDSNILINERIREEARNGRTPLNAMEVGFRRAYSTIVDSNVTALLAHIMLFAFGNGPVRGFAVTITVGIVSTLFTATLLARLLMVRWYAATRPQLLPV